MTTAMRSRPAGDRAAEALRVATPSSSAHSLTTHRHSTSAELTTAALVSFVTSYAAVRAPLRDDLRPPVGSTVVVERGPRDADVRGILVGYDKGGVLIEARFAFSGPGDVWIPWRAVRGIIEVAP